MTKPTLLQKAKSKPPIKSRLSRTAQEIELAIAWAYDEVSLTSVADVLHKYKSGTLAWLATTLREAYREGFVELSTYGRDERARLAEETPPMSTESSKLTAGELRKGE